MVEDAAQRGAMLVRQLLAFSRRQVLAPTVLDLNVVVLGFEPLLRRLTGEHVDLAIAAGARRSHVRADATQVEQVVMNLVVNARDAMPGGGTVRVETADVDLDAPGAIALGLAAGPYVRLTVADTGCGMSAATRARIFEPFFTTKEPGRGTGLGLATVYGIVRQSGGAIGVDSEPGRGTTFRIHLPAVSDAVTPAPARSAPPPVPGGAETILLVEDDDGVRGLAQTVLAAAGYTVLEARDGREALATAAAHAGPIHLLLTDLVMPRMSGAELATRLTSARADLRVVFMTGYSDSDLGPAADAATVLLKPISPEALATKVREALGAGVAA